MKESKKNKYKAYRKYDVIYADFGRSFAGVEGGVRPGIVMTDDSENKAQLLIVPLSTKIKNVPIHVVIEPSDVKGFRLQKRSDFMPEDMRCIPKGFVRAHIGYLRKDNSVREKVDASVAELFGFKDMEDESNGK